MDMSFESIGTDAILGALIGAAFSAERRSGAAVGKSADEIAKRVQRRWDRLGWGETSEIRPRRAKGGADEPTAYIIVEGGAAWQETGTSRMPPRPTVRPEVDSEIGRLERRIGDAIESVFEP